MSLNPHRTPAHGRSSSGRVAVTRRMTKGPLDADDALNDPLSQHGGSASTSTTATTTTTTTPSRVLSPARSPLASPPPEPVTTSHNALQEHISLDVSFLQDPSAYHVLPITAPLPFQHAANVPSVAAPIDSLLLSGHYRLAAIAAARNIVSAAAPTDYPTLFHLVHIRLACLCLINQHALAAQEAKVLGDLSSAFYRHPLTNAHLVPWDLRLLAVRLAALGYGEWRKGIMGYYELARECREGIVRAVDGAEKALWRRRLRDCGVRVANTLVDMGDLDGAGRHLATLTQTETDDGTGDATGNVTATEAAELRDVLIMETLVWLRVGHLARARQSLARATAIKSSDSNNNSNNNSNANETSNETLLPATLTALLHLADSNYPLALSSFQTLHTQYPTNPMITQNLAVCLLYTGHLSAAHTTLSNLIHDTPPFYSALFNLSTVFELCTERHWERKGVVADMLAGRRDGGGVGWERSAAEFKL